MLELHSCVSFCGVVASSVAPPGTVKCGYCHSSFGPEGKCSHSSQILNISSSLTENRSPQGWSPGRVVTFRCVRSTAQWLSPFLSWRSRTACLMGASQLPGWKVFGFWTECWFWSWLASFKLEDILAANSIEGAPLPCCGKLCFSRTSGFSLKVTWKVFAS